MNLFSPLSLFTGPYALLAKWGVIAALVLSFGAFSWVKGNQHGTLKLIEYQGAQAVSALAVITKQRAATEKVINHYIKVAGDTQVITQTITNEVTRYAEENSGTCLDERWRLLHDAAAANSIPPSGPSADGPVRAASAPPVREIPGTNGIGGTGHSHSELRPTSPMR